MSSSIGIMDWGIGGMSVYQALRLRGLTHDVVYFSDAGQTPYGRLPETDLRARFEVIGAYMKSQGCDRVLVACNAASSALKGEVEHFQDLPFYSIVPAGVHIVNQHQASNVGVIGGERTIQSGIYHEAFKHNPKHFAFCAAQPLSLVMESADSTNIR